MLKSPARSARRSISASPKYMESNMLHKHLRDSRDFHAPPAPRNIQNPSGFLISIPTMSAISAGLRNAGISIKAQGFVSIPTMFGPWAGTISEPRGHGIWFENICHSSENSKKDTSIWLSVPHSDLSIRICQEFAGFPIYHFVMPREYIFPGSLRAPNAIAVQGFE